MGELARRLSNTPRRSGGVQISSKASYCSLIKRIFAAASTEISRTWMRGIRQVFLA